MAMMFASYDILFKINEKRQNLLLFDWSARHCQGYDLSVTKYDALVVGTAENPRLWFSKYTIPEWDTLLARMETLKLSCLHLSIQYSQK